MAKTQKELIRDYIKEHGSITQMDANFDLSITKLSTRISEMRRDGENIIGETEKSINKFGVPCRYTRYRMGECSGS